MENFEKEKVNRPKKGLWQRLAALTAAAALALGLAACDASAITPGGSADVVPNPSSAAAAVDTVEAPFEMHFIDVGQALSVLVECDGQYMLYDGGNVDDGRARVWSSWNTSSAPTPTKTTWAVWPLRWPTSRRTTCTAR